MFVLAFSYPAAYDICMAALADFDSTFEIFCGFVIFCDGFVHIGGTSVFRGSLFVAATVLCPAAVAQIEIFKDFRKIIEFFHTNTI